MHHFIASDKIKQKITQFSLLLHDAMLAQYMTQLCVHLSVCHKTVFCQNN